MSQNTQLLTSDPFGTTFADPSDPNFTVRFKTSRSRKMIDGNPVDNYVTEIIVNDLHGVTVGGSSVNEALSVRIRVSGSELSMPRLKEIAASVAGQVSTWNSENVLLGFRPTTVPINPGV